MKFKKQLFPPKKHFRKKQRCSSLRIFWKNITMLINCHFLPHRSQQL